MSKIQKLIKALKLIIQNPALLNKVLDAPEVNQQEIKEKYNFKNGLKTIKITDFAPEINETVNPFSFLEGGSTPMDLALLRILAKRFVDCDYFEIGTWRGESVANVATIAKQCTSLNLPNTEMLNMGASKNYIDSHRFYSTKLNNVTHLEGNSLTYDFSSLNKKFDLIFIDGDHHFESVKSDTQNAFQLLKNEKSIIVWHDYGNDPTDVRWDVLNGIIAGTPNEKRNNLFHVSNTLCAVYINEVMPAQIQIPYSFPEHYFSVYIKSNKI